MQSQIVPISEAHSPSVLPLMISRQAVSSLMEAYPPLSPTRLGAALARRIFRSFCQLRMNEPPELGQQPFLREAGGRSFGNISKTDSVVDWRSPDPVQIAP